jgi:hypothetical protein
MSYNPLAATALQAGNNLFDLASASTSRTNLGIGNVENTALSTWAGSSNVVTMGTITTGIWNAGMITSTPAARTSGVASYFSVTTPTDTTLTASTESIGVNFLTGTRQWATGALTTQREHVIAAPTYAFVGASTITNAATLAITAAPIAGTNATITNAYALWVQAGITRLDGNVGIGTASPGGMLQVTSTASGTVGQIIQGAASQTANLLTVKKSDGTVIGAIGSAGQMGVGANAVASIGLVVSAGTSYGQNISPTITSNNGGGQACGPYFAGGFTSAYGVKSYAYITAGSSVTTGYNFAILGFQPIDSGDYIFGTEHGLYIGNLSLATDNTYGITSLVSAGSGKYNLNISGTAQNYIAGNVGIGTSSPNANAILDVTSTTKAFMPPRMTTTQKNAIASPTSGMVVFDSTLSKLCVYTGAAWQTITSI